MNSKTGRPGQREIHVPFLLQALLHSSVITADPGSRGSREFDEFLENCDLSQSSESQSQSQGDNSSALSPQSSSSQTRGRRRKEARKSSQSKVDKVPFIIVEYPGMILALSTSRVTTKVYYETLGSPLVSLPAMLLCR